MLLHSRTSHPVGVSSSLSVFFAHAVVSCLCAVGSAHTCRLLPSLSQLILLASDQRLLSEWIRLLISHFPLLIAIFLYSVVTCFHSQIIFLREDKFSHPRPISSLQQSLVLGILSLFAWQLQQISVLPNCGFVFCLRASSPTHQSLVMSRQTTTATLSPTPAATQWQFGSGLPPSPSTHLPPPILIPI